MLRGLGIVAVWAIAVLAVLFCALAAYLESVDWGDGDDESLTALEAVALLGTAVLAVAAAVWVTARLSRGGDRD